MAFIEIVDLKKSINNIEIIKGVGVSIEKGTTVGLIGNNGSGKTVLLKIICGFYKATEGFICIDGKVVGKDMDFYDSMGMIIETPGFMGKSSGYQNLKLLAGIKKIIGKDQIISTMKLVGLNPHDKKHVAKYSMGMRQRLAIAQAIMENPELLILDEPFNGLDYQGVVEMRQVLQNMKELGKTVIISSHNQDDVAILCDQVYEMEAGKIREVSVDRY